MVLRTKIKIISTASQPHSSLTYDFFLDVQWLPEHIKSSLSDVKTTLGPVAVSYQRQNWRNTDSRHWINPRIFIALELSIAYSTNVETFSRNSNKKHIEDETHTREWCSCVYIREMRSRVQLYTTNVAATHAHITLGQPRTHKPLPICDSYAACDTAWTVYCVHIYKSRKKGTKKKPNGENKIVFLKPENSQSAVYNL